MSITEQQARENLKLLLEEYYNLSPEVIKSATESMVLGYIERLFRDVLGWPTEDLNKFQHEKIVAKRKRVDRVLLLDNDDKIYIEAKKFGVIDELSDEWTVRPGQMALPGMAIDRTQEEQQAINYAFENNGTWAILTNFERFRLFNARRDWLVFSFERPRGYEQDFELLWQLSWDNIHSGSLDTLSNQRWTKEVDTDYLAFINQQREQLAIDITLNRDNNLWAYDETGALKLGLLRTAVQRFLDRLVIVRFAEDHYVIPPNTLQQFYLLRTQSPYYTNELRQYLHDFFRHFDHVHNSALFALSDVDQAQFSDDVLLPLIDKLYEARYRAMPADIIGNTYEQYLGKTLVLDNGSVKTRDNLETRKKQGSYYTPQVIVRYIVDNSLGRYLYGTHNGRADGNLLDGETRKTSQDIRELRVLDSACGSGSFLIYAYQILAEFYQAEIQRLSRQHEQLVKDIASNLTEILLDDRVNAQRIEDERDFIRLHYRRLILEKHIYGVDLDPQAAEIAVVNLMMRAMERKGQDKRLPLILNQNVKVGNGLIGLRPDDSRLADHAEPLATIRRLRAELIDTSNIDPRHEGIIDELKTATECLYAEFHVDYSDHFTNLDRVRPFHWAVEFPEVFFDEDGKPLDNAGFHIIFGNPPWEIVKPDLREFYAQFDPDIESKLTRKKAEKRIAELNAEDPRYEVAYNQQKITIEESAKYFRATGDYMRQGRGDTATHKLFMERMYSLLGDKGRLGYIVPSGIYTDLGTKDLRGMLLNDGRIESLYSFTNGVSGGQIYFAEVHRSFKITMLLAQKAVSADSFLACFRIDPRDVPIPDNLLDFLADPNNFIEVKPESIQRFSPDSLSIMEFQSEQDYQIAEKIYDDHPTLGEEIGNSWNIKFAREFDMTNDRHLFNQIGQGLPLYEGKMIHQFTASHAEPRYWIKTEDGKKKLSNSKAKKWHQGYRFAFREIARSTDERTCIATVLPPNTFAGHTLWVGVAPDYKVLLFYISLVNSFCVDWIARFKVGTHVTLFVMKSLPMPRLTEGNPYFDALVPRAAQLVCMRQEFADLWQEVMGNDWGKSKGTITAEKRQGLRDEIDAIVAHLYGLSRTEFEHILGTFPLVFPDDVEGQAKKERLLGVYDDWVGRL
jgi:hypothetical protein